MIMSSGWILYLKFYAGAEYYMEFYHLQVYSKMGFSDDALGKHFGGPAFLAW